MNFTTKTRKASYNGVGFEVTTGSLSFGRRTVVHEFPFRDTPYTEDLGRATRDFSITGFIVGNDYVDRTKRLIEACEKSVSAETPGKLVHPWLGTLDVVVTDKPQLNWDLNKRFASFTINFVELQKQKDPSQSISWGDKLRASVDDFINQLTSSFGMTMEELMDEYNNFSSIIDDNVQKTLGILSDSNLSKIFDLTDGIADFASNAKSLLGTSPKSFVSGLVSAIGLGGYINSVRDWSRATSATVSVVSKSVFNAKTDKAVASSTSYKSTTSKAEVAVESVMRQVMISNAVGVASIIGTSLDSSNEDDNVEALPFSAREDEDTRTIRDNLLNLIEQEMLYTESNDTELYESLETLYINTYKALTENVIGSDVIDYKLTESVPTLVLAYDLYGDASRADEISIRNGIVNGSFVPVKILKVAAQ